MLNAFRLLALCLLFVSPAAARDSVRLKHDDGSQDGKRSISGAGHAVRFECPEPGRWYVTAVAVHGSRYGAARAPDEDFRVVIASADLSRRAEVGRPYSLFKRGKEDWVKIDIDPVEVEGAFQAAVFFNPTRTKGVYVGVDADAAPSHSSVVLASEPGKPESELEGDWMIRVYLARAVEGEARSLLDEGQRAQRRTSDDQARDAAILGDARSLTLRHDQGGESDHMNIQGAVYTVAFQTPKDVVGYVWQVQVYASEFGGRHDSNAVSGDVYVLDAERRVVSRTTFPYSLASQQKKWVSIPTLPTRVQGKFYIGIDTHGERTKGLYVGYEEGNQKAVASTDELSDGRVLTQEWSSKFKHMQWLIRAKIADRPVSY